MSSAICLATATARAAPCPRTPQQSNAWINRAVEDLVRSAYAAYQDESAQARHQRVVDGLADTIQRCRLTADAGLSSRYPEFFDYVKLLSIAGRGDHELGFEVTDKDYFAETSQYTTIPDFLLTPAFLRLVSRFENLPQAKSFLRDLNKSRTPSEQLLFFSYASRHLGTPDNPDSYRRLLIVVPADNARDVPEKWVQFGIADPRKPRTVRNVSVVAVMRGANDEANVYFKDYFRTYRRNGSISIKGRWELGEGDDPCVTCHKSGVLPIFPVAGTVAGDEKEVLEAVNARFRGYGTASFGRYIDRKKFGPGLGTSPANPDSRIPLLTTRFNTQGCTVCHNANGLGAFNWPMDSTIIKSFVTGGKMPLNANLSRVARTQLYKQLVNEYFAVDETRPGILQAWLLRKIRVVQTNEVESNTP
ncbi:MAG TPA: hypothetical protein VNG71_06655 [Pyrinomonadaceae bacterium]|nr:hypothetical protein [Pyrinomonadaceae bacterium]